MVRAGLGDASVARQDSGTSRAGQISYCLGNGDVAVIVIFRRGHSSEKHREINSGSPGKVVGKHEKTLACRNISGGEEDLGMSDSRQDGPAAALTTGDPPDHE